MTKRLITTAVGILGLLTISCTSSSTPTQTQTNANYDSQFREQTRSSQTNYATGGQLSEGAQGDPPITIMLLSMETGNVHPGEDYYVYAVVDNPDNREIEYVWSVANGDVSEVSEAERGRLTALIETEYASGGAAAPPAEGQPGAVGAGTGAGAAAGAGGQAPPGAAPPSGFQRPGGGGSPSSGFSSGGPTAGAPSGGGTPGGSVDQNGQPQGRLEVPANPGTGGSPDASLAPGAGPGTGGPLKGGAEDEEEESTTKSEDEEVDDESAEPGTEDQAEEPGSEDPEPEQDDETALVLERRQVAGPAAAQEGEEPADDADEDTASDDTDEPVEETAMDDEPERADATGAAAIAERISEGSTSAGTMADDAVLAGDPEDYSSLSVQYERWKEGTGEFRRQPLGPYGEDSEVESLESEESFEQYTFVTDEPFILWTPRMPGETTIYLKLTYKEEDLTDPAALDVTVRLKDPSVELADDFPEIVREDQFAFIRLDGENIPSFQKGLFTLEYDFNKLSFREAELGAFFDDAPDASLYYAQPDKNAGKVLLAIDTNTELVNLSGDGELVYVKFEAKQDIGDMTDTGLQLLSNASASYILDRNGENVLPQPIDYPVFRTEVTTPPQLPAFNRENTPGAPQQPVAGAGGAQAPRTGTGGQPATGGTRQSGGGSPAAAGAGGQTIGTPTNPQGAGPAAAGGGIPLGPLAGGVPPGEGAVAGGVAGGLVPNEDRIVQESDNGGTAPGTEGEQAEPGGEAPADPYTEMNVELTNAIRDANVEALQQLLDQGADPNWLDPATGLSALHLAVLEANTEAVSVMIERRADPNIRSSEGKSAFDYAEDAEMTEILTILQTSPAGRR